MIANDTKIHKYLAILLYWSCDLKCSIYRYVFSILFHFVYFGRKSKRKINCF